MSLLGDVLKIPVATAVGGAVGSITKNLFGNGTQQQTNFAAANGATKQGETLLRLQDSGTATKFTGISKDVNIKTLNNSVIAQDAESGENLGEIQRGDEEGISANMMGGDNTTSTNLLKVRLSASPSIIDGDSITLMVMPTISESRTANYDSFTPTHHPGDIYKYKGTGSRSWSIETQLISRNSDEASDNLRKINIIRSWVMPFYGTGTGENPETAEYLGAPPPILTLSAYGQGMIGAISCVLETYNWTWPNDVDYITTNTGQPFPVIMSISLTLKEALSPAQYSGFDLLSYKLGNMGTAFMAVTADRKPAQPSSTPTAPQTPDAASIPDGGESVDLSTAFSSPQTPVSDMTDEMQSVFAGGTSITGASSTSSEVDTAEL